ncbi:MAG: hypothetical protein CL578_08310 [Alteromonadaceae bacterium]|uniref:Uncharacterized protein n=2 Tax=Paraglaciecola chathamensis TaxID=368405 RepID=A0ABQ0I689_9ALTE|nr:hypothetical protein [Alteromonadaceae bacterium]GAC04868.1 hypothetical protein GAGA_2015 [Paraglaciecola agarilytica NO2]GAC11438.1 hypothetical protein GCHA_3508 [Paraglaciecola chathamensis S18K6]
MSLFFTDFVWHVSDCEIKLDKFSLFITLEYTPAYQLASIKIPDRMGNVNALIDKILICTQVKSFYLLN